MIKRLIKRIKKAIVNNKGTTLVEMLMTFTLLAIFMVAGTRVISYTIGIYYTAKGNVNGCQVSNILYEKISGQVENAINEQTPQVLSDGSLRLVDKTGSEVVIGLTPPDELNRRFLDIHYVESGEEGEEGRVEATEWLFDEKMYLGYSIKTLRFENPNETSPGMYPENVVRLNLVINSPKYGEFTTNYYIKCYNCDKVEFKN